MLNRSTTWAVALLVATFAAGIAVGAGGRALWVRHAAAAAPVRPRGVDQMMAELDDELHLTPAQHDSLHAILQRHWTQMSALWDKVRPPFDALRAAMDSEVSQQLTPEQQARYRDHVARYRHQKEQTKTDSSARKD